MNRAQAKSALSQLDLLRLLRTCIRENEDHCGNIVFLDPGDDAMEQLNRITQRPDLMGGKACIRGMRVTVGMIVGQIGAGRSIDDLLAEYPYLEREDILQALRYARVAS